MPSSRRDALACSLNTSLGVTTDCRWRQLGWGLGPKRSGCCEISSALLPQTSASLCHRPPTFGARSAGVHEQRSVQICAVSTGKLPPDFQALQPMSFGQVGSNGELLVKENPTRTIRILCHRGKPRTTRIALNAPPRGA